MNIKYINMTGFGATAWNLDDQPVEIPSMHHRHHSNNTLVLHPHEKSNDGCRRAQCPVLHKSHRSGEDMYHRR